MRRRQARRGPPHGQGHGVGNGEDGEFEIVAEELGDERDEASGKVELMMMMLGGRLARENFGCVVSMPTMR